MKIEEEKNIQEYPKEEYKKRIPFLEKTDQLEKICSGFSGAIIYQIIRNDKQYFLKIMKNRPNATLRIKEIRKAYQECNIDTANLIDCGVMEQEDLYYCIYDWIEGTPLSELIKENKVDYFYAIGKEIGEKLKAFEKYKKPTQYIEKAGSLKKRIDDWFKVIDQIPQKEMKKYFTSEQINTIKSKMLVYQKSFDQQEQCLVHTDIKLGNILVKEKQIYLIDIEDMCYDYEICNLIRWPINVFMNDIRGNCEKAFQKGILEILGKEKNEKEIVEQTLFLYMANFCSVVPRKIKTKNKLEQLELYQNAYEQTQGFTKLNIK